MPGEVGAPGGELGRQLRATRRVLALMDRLVAERDVEHIARLVTKSVPRFGAMRGEGVVIERGATAVVGSNGELPRAALGALATIESCDGGRIELDGRGWAWAFPLPGPAGRVGHLLISADQEPARGEIALVALLAQQAGLALANASQHDAELARANELRSAVGLLEQRIALHERLSRAAASDGEFGIAEALFDLTGRSALIEDRHGNLIVWAGPGRPEPYPRDLPTNRSQLLREATLAGGPIRSGDRLLAVASAGDEFLEAVALLDPEHSAGEREQYALGYAANVLALELVKLHKRVRDDLRARGELVMGLITGSSPAGSLGRALALDYDLGRAHYVAVIETGPVAVEQDERNAVLWRTSRESGAGSLFLAEEEQVVLLTEDASALENLRIALALALHVRHCRVGVGRRCETTTEYPHSFREARHALNLQKKMDAPPKVTLFEDLGIYQLLSVVGDSSAVEEFVRRWLGRLLDHDAQHGSQLVNTLGTYFDFGGSYERTAAALFVHRNTLKYRLARIRELLGADLAAPEINFNLQLATRAFRTLTALREEA